MIEPVLRAEFSDLLVQLWIRERAFVWQLETAVMNEPRLPFRSECRDCEPDRSFDRCMSSRRPRMQGVRLKDQQIRSSEYLMTGVQFGGERLSEQRSIGQCWPVV